MPLPPRGTYEIRIIDPSTWAEVVVVRRLTESHWSADSVALPEQIVWEVRSYYADGTLAELQQVHATRSR